MTEKEDGTFLIITADDFGRSHAVNRAVERAARQGILRCASLMVNGAALSEAVEIAERIPALETGLHLTLTEGKPVCAQVTSPDLVKSNGHFKHTPTRTGLAIRFRKEVRRQVEREVAAQFEAYTKTRLPLSHVDCHHHFHVHPDIFDLVIKNALIHEVRSVRIPYEPWEVSGPICSGNRLRNLFYRMVFTGLTAGCRKKLLAAKMLAVDGVFGLYQTEQITETWLLKLLERLAGRPGTFELYTHPTLGTDGSEDEGNGEFKALISPAVQDKIKESGIILIHYQDINR